MKVGCGETVPFKLFLTSEAPTSLTSPRLSSVQLCVA